MNAHLVFVYGTLRKGEKNAHFLSNAVCLDENCTLEGQLYDTGSGYPALLKEKGTLPVRGELYRVTLDQLKELDRLEGYEECGKNNLYERIMAKVSTVKGEHDAIVYVMNDKKSNFVVIDENDWITYCT